MPRTMRTSEKDDGPNGVETADLVSLFRAVATGDNARVSRLLRSTPELARASITVGVTRADAAAWFVADAGKYIMTGDTALHFAAGAYRPALCKKLLHLGADVRARNRRGATPLHAACTGAPDGRRWNPPQQVQTIEALIDDGADPNCVDGEGATPLHRAVRTRCADAVRVLLERGANPRLKNKGGSTPARLAVLTTGRGGSGTPAAKAQQALIVRSFVDRGVRVHA